jgi:tetratricopeptide (TPR) repeat protein
MHRLLAAALLLVAGVGQVLAGQVVPPASSKRATDVPRLQRWVDFAERHLPGQTDAAALEVASWSRLQLETLLRDFKALVQLIGQPTLVKQPRWAAPFTPLDLALLKDLAERVKEHAGNRSLSSDGEEGAVNRIVRRGTLLHTDIGLLIQSVADHSNAGLPPDRYSLLPLRSAVWVEDGRQTGAAYYGAHWDFARHLLNETVPDVRRDLTAKQWYRTVAAVFAIQRLLTESDAHLIRARQVFPVDAELAAASGRLHETYAAPRVQSFIEEGGSNDVRNVVGSERSNLRKAEASYRKAIELDSQMLEARLHLGRVMGLGGRHEDAIDQLRNVTTAAASDPPIQYLAWLFLGVEEQALGRKDGARESFERAAGLYPNAQSPHLALSQLARRSGDRAGALAAIQALLALPASAGERDDPWWSYLDGRRDRTMKQLADLRVRLYLKPEEH